MSTTIPLIPAPAPPVPTPSPGLRITVCCPTVGCDGRVEFTARKFHGAPVSGECQICRTGYQLSGGILTVI